jgi:phage terminase large subunit-like protein
MKNVDYIRLYWEQIRTEKVVACKRLIQQYAKIMDELDHPRPPWVFDVDKASQPINFIEQFCKHSKGKWIGKPVRLELFQKAKIQAVYGFVHKDTGMRRCREVFTCVARKNGKSTEKAATGNFMLVGDGEGGSEVYSVATKKDQARIVFSEAVNMVSQSPALSKHVKKRKTDLYFPVTFSKFEPLASDSNSLDGLNTHNCIMDELHAIKDRNLYDVMKQSMAAREQPLLDMITTAGFVRECIFDDIYDYACKVLDGVITDDRFLAFIYELDDRSEWTDFRMWEKANPGLGTIKSYDELAANVERAKHDANFLPTVLTKDFNIRSTVANSYLTFEEANNQETFDMEELRDCYMVGGIDLSAVGDLTSISLLGMKPDSEKIYCISHSFMPGDLVDDKVKTDKVPYDRWIERGLITPCQGHKVDYTYITEWLIKMREEYGVIAYWCGYDSWNSPSLIEDLENKMGYKNRQSLLPVIMGAKTLSAPMKLMKADLGENKINYNNNPLLLWAFTNTGLDIDKNENWRPIKHQQRQRIDPMMSTLIAYTILQNNLADYKALVGV